ncbi:DUF3240 family protein [Sphingobium aquiterrae]|uniref:DUF3240 family protein n=1 Tax=Sphingobium aquiterrae TaxID=2038656 RepID=UPI0030190DAB
MAEVLLTLHCATVDAEPIIDAIRALSRAPVHLRAEDVRGHDFGDARTAEKVMGTLKRSAIELIEDEAAVDAILEAIAATRRRSAVRWHLTPISGRGRLA